MLRPWQTRLVPSVLLWNKSNRQSGHLYYGSRRAACQCITARWALGGQWSAGKADPVPDCAGACHARGYLPQRSQSCWGNSERWCFYQWPNRTTTSRCSNPSRTPAHPNSVYLSQQEKRLWSLSHVSWKTKWCPSQHIYEASPLLRQFLCSGCK